MVVNYAVWWPYLSYTRAALILLTSRVVNFVHYLVLVCAYERMVHRGREKAAGRPKYLHVLLCVCVEGRLAVVSTHGYSMLGHASVWAAKR